MAYPVHVAGQSLLSIGSTLKLGRTDAAGVLYFTAAIELAHETVETWLESRGVGIARLLAAGPHLPIVHTEANFKSPLRVGDPYTVSLDSLELSRKSVTFHSRILGPGGRVVAEITTAHACVDPTTGKSIPIPSTLKGALTSEA